MEIGAEAPEGLGRSDIFHIVKEILGFVLYIHHQIPSILQHIENEYDALKEEYKTLEETCLSPNETKASDRRKHNLRKREIKQGIRRMEKVTCKISTLLSALQLALDEMPDIQEVILVLGGSLIRPRHVYHLVFNGGKLDFGRAPECTKSKVADFIAKKSIRALISAGVGSFSLIGPSKLFLLVRSYSTFRLPLHFLPKRDFRFSSKVVPLKLHIKCKVPIPPTRSSDNTLLASVSTCPNSNENDVMWFQCKHAIKGLACKVPSEC